MVLALFFLLIYLVTYYYDYYFVLVFWTGANNSSLIFSSQSWESVPLDWSTHSRYLPFQELSHVLGPPTSNLVASSSFSSSIFFFSSSSRLWAWASFTIFLFLLSELCNLILLKTQWIDQSLQITIPNNSCELCSNSSRPDWDLYLEKIQLCEHIHDVQLEISTWEYIQIKRHLMPCILRAYKSCLDRGRSFRVPCSWSELWWISCLWDMTYNREQAS